MQITRTAIRPPLALTIIEYIAILRYGQGMPLTTVLIFADEQGYAPLMDWIRRLEPRVQAKLTVRIELLEERGHELRRPLADLLRDGVHELRARVGTVHYRILYFFEGGNAVLSHGLTKVGAVSDSDIDLVLGRQVLFKGNPKKHTYGGGSK
jgi:hypothetical protein